MSNRLKNETSPYLLQHAQNPVDWFPWGEKAFDRARLEDKPVFLSIGYSSCHWCHEMAHECFEDEEVAALMNNTFISVKVDREEMPHIDHIYMQACQVLTGSGGWPLSIIMTPDKQPFFAATYLPKHTRGGIMGMMELIGHIDKLWHGKRGDVMNEASQISRYIKNSMAIQPGNGLDPGLLAKTYSELKGRFSLAYGGFGPAPKFPMPHNIMFLLRYYRRTHDQEALDMASATLTSMQQGGIYDHIGFGFHRYATDEQWLVPHFEKMLYDQALLAFAYTEAHQVTARLDFRKTAEDILTYVLRDMRTTEGLFASAQDADSKEGEGRYYLWTAAEVKSAMEDAAYTMAKEVFGLHDEGNFPAGMEDRLNIMRLKGDVAGLAGRLGLNEEEYARRVRLILESLYKARLTRSAPFKDSKVLTDWNGLMIAALAKAGAAFAKPEFVDAAKTAADFILNTMPVGGTLKHVYMTGTARLEGGIDDYAFLIWGLIELYEATFEPGYLKAALELNAILIKHFRDIPGGGFLTTAETDEVPLARTKTANDNAIPSGNSVAMLNLLRLAGLTGEASLRDLAVETGKAFSGLVSRIPSAYTFMMCALDFMAGPSHEVVIAGESGQRDTKDMIDAVRMQFLPNTVILLKTDDGNDLPVMKNKHPIRGKATAYVCTGSSCLDPFIDVGEMIHFLTKKGGP